MKKTLDEIRGLKRIISAISLDFLKTFDRVDRDFIFSALHMFGYRNKFFHII